MQNAKKTKKETMPIRISKEVYEKIRDFAEEKGLKQVDMVSRCLDRAINSKPELFIP